MGYTPWPLCIPLRVNSGSILSISSERIGIFQLNLATLIQVSIEAFWHFYNWNLKHLRMSKLHLFITKYYLQVSWHDMNLKLTLGYFLINKVGHWFYQLDHVTFSKNVFWSVNFDCPFAKFITPKCPLYGLFKCWHFY